MFGQQSSPFGAPASTPFGSSAQQTPAFGQAPSTPFGSPPAAAPSSFGFGSSSAPAPSFGGFGAQAPASQPSAFGSSTNVFGQPAPAPAFGGFGSTPAPAPSTGLFGRSSGAPASTGPFGTPAPSGGLFGSSAAPAPMGFGSPAPAPAFGGSAFGASSTSSAFGASTSTQGFGAPAPAGGGLFGAPAPAAPAFGAAPSAFGSSQGATGSTMFGAAPSASVQGTASVPFQVTRKQDGTTHINFQSITAMPQYENKSFEELRLEDYMSGNKGGGSAGSSSGFGQSTSTGFGAPAAPSGGLFGSPAPAPTGGLFGAPAPAPSAFGSTAPAPSSGFAFGSPAPAPSGGLFGSPAPAPSGGLFGAPAPATGGMFGSTSASAPSFGGFGAAKPPATGGLFGAPAPAPSGGLFGAPAPAPTAFGTTAPAPTSSGFSFGSTPAPAPAGGLFGASSAPATATSGFSFGGASAPAPSTGLFGSAPAPSTSGGLFGGSTPAPATGGLFGSTPTPATTSGGLFGGSSFSSTTAPAPSGGLFGSAAPAPSGGLFGASTSSQQGGFLSSAATTTSSAATNTILIPPSSETLLAQQMAAIETQSKDLAVLEAWRQGSSSSQKSKQKSLTSSSIGQSNYYRGTSMAIGSPYSTYKSPGVKSVTKIRPRGFGPTPTKSSLASLGTSSPGLLSPSAYLGSATKQLIINPDAYAHKPKVRLLLTDDSSSGKENKSTRNDSPSQRMLQLPLPSSAEIPLKESHATPDQSQVTSPGSTKQQNVESKPDSFRKNPILSPEIDESYDFYQKVVGSNKSSSVSKPTGSGSARKEKKTFAPSLTKAGYTCFPPMETLSKMSEADLAAVSNFVVERIGVGSVAWDGAVDVRDVDLDSVVTIENKAVEVYHREEELGTKPSVGTKLNRPAVITLHGVYSKNGPNATPDEKEKFELKIAKKTKELGAELIMIDSDEGIWKIKVMHFSRYALDDDSDDDIDDLVENTEQGSTTDFQSGVRGGRTQVSNDSSWIDLEGSKIGSQGFSRIIVPENDDEVMEESGNLLLKEPKAKLSISAADNAYSFISGSKVRWTESEDEETTPRSMFSVEGACNTEYARNKVICSILHDSQVSNMNYCANIAAKYAISRPTSSATDFGMRLGRSFRVGWRCDGSYVHPTTLDSNGEKQSKTLSFSRPVLDENEVSAKEDLLSIHLKYSSFTSDDTDAPIFSLSCNSDKAVQAAMRDYSESLSMRLASGSKVENTLRVASEAFSLIDVLFRRIGGQETNELHRRDQAFGIWLKDLCSHEAHNDLKSAKQDQDLLTAVFSALSSGNKWKASNIAQEGGFHTLALMIANSNNSARSSLTTQIEAWKASGAFRHVPSELLRIQYILTSDLSMEEALYQESKTSTAINSGWKHRFASLFQSISNESMLPDTSRIIVARNRYKLDVERGVAPECYSWFVDSNGYECIDEYQSVLVRIMDLFDANKTGAGHISLSDIVNPKGHNPNFFDTSTSFHLASVLSSLHVCDDLSDSDEHALLDFYATQLLSAGMWEWAVYVSLCTFKKNELCPFVIQNKVAMAKRIINSQYPSSTTLEAKNKRKFLEDTLKIPSSWFNDSFATYCISTFNVKGYFEVVTQSSMEDSLRVYEESILTDSLFEGGRENCYLLLQVLNTLKPGEQGSSLSLSKVVCDYLSLLRDVGIYISGDQTDYTSSNLLSRIQMIQLDLIKLESDCRTESSWKSFSALPVIPRSVVLKELLKSVSYMMAQIEGHNRLEQRHQPSVTGLVPALSALNENFQFEKSDLDCRALLRAKFPLKMSHSDGDTVFIPKLYRT